MSGPATELLLWGASGHGRVVADLVAQLPDYRLGGFIDDQRAGQHCGLPILGGREELTAQLGGRRRQLIITVGNPQNRLEMAAYARALGFELATLIHPAAVVAADVEVGAGTVIVAGAIVNSGSRLGECVIVNTRASVDHDCEVGDGATICPGVTIGGRTRIGRATWIGIGATVLDGVTVGPDSYVGGGAVVVDDLPPGVLAYGVPATVRRSLK